MSCSVEEQGLLQNMRAGVTTLSLLLLLLKALWFQELGLLGLGWAETRR